VDGRDEVGRWWVLNKTWVGWRAGGGGEVVWRRVTRVPARRQEPNVSEALARIWTGGVRDVLKFLSSRDLAGKRARFFLEIWSLCPVLQLVDGADKGFTREGLVVYCDSRSHHVSSLCPYVAAVLSFLDPDDQHSNHRFLHFRRDSLQSYVTLGQVQVPNAAALHILDSFLPFVMAGTMTRHGVKAGSEMSTKLGVRERQAFECMLEEIM
jgi:hypothetical protein